MLGVKDFSKTRYCFFRPFQLVLMILLFIVSVTVVGANNLVDLGMTCGSHTDTIWVGEPATFDIYIENDNTLTAMQLGFYFWSPDGATWQWRDVGGYGPSGPGTGHACITVVPGCRMDPPSTVWNHTGLLVSEKDMDEISPDSLMFGGNAATGGLAAGPLEHMISFNFTAGPDAGGVYQLCIDSTKIPVAGDFVFIDITGTYTPQVAWPSGGLCWPVKRIPNLPPIFTNCPTGMLYAPMCEVFEYVLEADDPEQEPLVFELLSYNGAGSAWVDAATGLVNCDFVPGDIGASITVVVQVCDAYELCDICSFDIAVINEAPVIDCGVPEEYVVGGNTLVKSDIIGIDPDVCPLPLFYSIVSGPGTIDPNIGEYTWSTTVEDIGPWDVEIEVSDGYDTDRCIFLIHVTEEQYTAGDANGDGNVNIGDAVYINNFVFHPSECIENPPIGCPPDPYEAGDANCDEMVNIGDGVFLLTYIFRDGPSPGCDPVGLLEVIETITPQPGQSKTLEERIFTVNFEWSYNKGIDWVNLYSVHRTTHVYELLKIVTCGGTLECSGQWTGPLDEDHYVFTEMFGSDEIVDDVTTEPIKDEGYQWMDFLCVNCDTILKCTRPSTTGDWSVTNGAAKVDPDLGSGVNFTINGILHSDNSKDVTIVYTATDADGDRGVSKWNVTVYDAKLKNPNGDPTTGANSTNERTFNAASPGVLTVECEATARPDLPAVRTLLEDNRIRWTIVGGIGASVLTWNSTWPGDATKGEGLAATATFTGLPTNNTSFGLKVVKMEILGDKVSVSSDSTTNIEVFYTGTAKNHPGGDPTHPNWFHYYKQNAGGGAYGYEPAGRSHCISAGGIGSIRIGNEAYLGDQYIVTTILPGPPPQLTAIVWSEFHYYYANFLGVLAHETQHATGEVTQGGPTDPDGDWLATAFENSTSITDPADKYSASGFLGRIGAWSDDEIYAGGPCEQNGILGANTSQDWAAPGTNKQN